MPFVATPGHLVDQSAGAIVLTFTVSAEPVSRLSDATAATAAVRQAFSKADAAWAYERSKRPSAALKRYVTIIHAHA